MSRTPMRFPSSFTASTLHTHATVRFLIVGSLLPFAYHRTAWGHCSSFCSSHSPCGGATRRPSAATKNPLRRDVDASSKVRPTARGRSAGTSSSRSSAGSTQRVGARMANTTTRRPPQCWCTTAICRVVPRFAQLSARDVAKRERLQRSRKAGRTVVDPEIEH